MKDDRRQAIRRLLETHHTITLATCEDERPWAATVFYASDAALSLYFVSDRRTRHGRHLAASGLTAGAVNPDCASWGEVQGLQLEGRVTVLTGVAHMAALKRYLTKFPEIGALFEKPQDQDEATIAKRLWAADFYKLTPGWIRLIDNRLGFGCKAELHDIQAPFRAAFKQGENE